MTRRKATNNSSRERGPGWLPLVLLPMRRKISDGNGTAGGSRVRRRRRMGAHWRTAARNDCHQVRSVAEKPGNRAIRAAEARSAVFDNRWRLPENEPLGPTALDRAAGQTRRERQNKKQSTVQSVVP